MKDKMMDDDIENVGIMQGFMDSMADEGDDEGDDDEEKMMERRPDSPEILMNNLRGDMRSLEARRDELADLVGYKAATETPEAVLAMLQPVLAQQGGGGIGALPQSGPMAQGPQPPMMGAAPGAAPGGAPGGPPPGMPPMPPDAGAGAPPPPGDGGIAALMAGMGGGAPGGAPAGPPPGMPPGDMPPIAMARGGYVQHFQTGSDKSGVTPADDQSASDPAASDLLQYPKNLVDAARAASSGLINQQPAKVPSLEGAMKTRLPEYQKLLGSDRGMAEAQMLFDLGQRAFGFAANTDDSGRPLRGSFISRLAGATKTLPTAIGRRIDEINKIDRQIKTLALQQGEKDIDQVNAQNAELQKRKSGLLAEVLRAQARVDAKAAGAKDTGPLGRGSKGDILNTFIQFAPLYKAGSLLPEQERTFLTAVQDYTQEQRMPFTDAETGITKIITYRNSLPDYVREALNARRPGSAPAPSAMTTVPSGAGAPAGAGAGRPARPAGAGAVPTGPMGLVPGPNVPDEVFQAASVAPKSTFFDLAATGTGFVPVLVAGIARNVPVDAAGKIAPDFQQSTTMLKSMTNRIVNVLQENPRFPEGERKQILDELGTAPSVFSNRNGYINTIVALDKVMEDLQKKANSIINNEKTGVQTRKEQQRKLEDISSIRDLFGIQQRTITDPEVWKTLPPGEYIVIDPRTGFKVLQPKYANPAAR